MTTPKASEWKPLFYAKEEYNDLFEQLLKGVERSRTRKMEAYQGGEPEVAVRPFVERRLMELGSAAQDALEHFHMWRNGELDRTIKLLEELPGLVSSLNANLLALEPVFKNYGSKHESKLSDDAQKLLYNTHKAAEWYEQCYGWTHEGIKSEGGYHSKHLANACLNEFLIFVCTVWHQSTTERIAVGSGKGEFGCFAETAVMPLATKMCCHIPKLDPTDWAKWTNLAARLRRLDVRDQEFLTSDEGAKPD